MALHLIKYNISYKRGGYNSILSSMALCSTKYNHQFKFFSMFNFLSSSFFLFFSIIVIQPLQFPWVFSCWFWFCLIPWRDWFVCVHSHSTWRMCKNAWSLMIFLWLDMVPKHGGAWIINVGTCTHLCAQLWTYKIRSFEALGAWRNWFLHNSLCFQSLFI